MLYILLPTAIYSYIILPTINFCLQGKDVNDSDEFVYNKEFRHRMCRIKINQVQLKETVCRVFNSSVFFEILNC